MNIEKIQLQHIKRREKYLLYSHDLNQHMTAALQTITTNLLLAADLVSQLTLLHLSADLDTTNFIPETKGRALL